MAKKYFGKLLTLAAVLSAAAAGVSYVLQYKSFHKELDEDFHDFEDDFDGFDDADDNESDSSSIAATERSYVSLNPEKKDSSGSDDILKTSENNEDSTSEDNKDSASEDNKDSASEDKDEITDKQDSDTASADKTTVTVEEITE